MLVALLDWQARLHQVGLDLRLRAFRDRYLNRLVTLEYLEVLLFHRLIDIHLRHFGKEF